MTWYDKRANRNIIDREGDGTTFPLSSYAYDTLVEDEELTDGGRDRDLEQQ